MPSTRFSTHFLILLCIKDAETGREIWDDPDILSRFGITCRPSTNPQDPVPNGLTKEKAAHIRLFTDSIQIRVTEERPEWINDGQECAAGREFYQRWFSSGKSSGLAVTVNKVIDAALMEFNVYPGQQVDEERPDEFPSSDAAARDAAVDIAAVLIGDYRFGKDGMTMRKDVRDAVSAMIRLAYERLKKKWNTSKKTLEPRRKAADDIMADIEKSETISLTVLRQAINKVASYKNAATLRFGEHERIEVYEASLQALLEKAGKKTSERRQAALSRKGESRVSSARIRMSKKSIINADLSDKADIERTWALFVDEFVVAEVGTSIQLAPDNVAINTWEGNLGDCGIDRYRTTSTEELCRLLGFPEGRPRTWARYRSADVSINAWDSPNLPLFTGLRPDADPKLPIPPNAQKVELTWHQLVGVASMISKAFSSVPEDDVPGVIHADGVGVGKTAQGMAFLACLQNIWLSEQPDSKTPRPPIVEGLKYFMGKEGVPNLPHLVVIPNTLLDQWRREWKSFASPFSLDIFEYPTTTDADFFDSPKWTEESITQNIFRVILMPQSVFQTMSGKVFDTGNTGRKGKPIDCVRKVKSERAYTRSIFSRQFCTFFWDEAHDLRSSNQKWVGAVQMRKRTRFVWCATATPIYQSPKDVIYIGRVIGLPKFILENGSELEKRGNLILKAKTLMTPEERKATHLITEARLRGEDTSGMYDPTAEHVKESTKFVQELQRGLEGRMIRRTSDSLKPDGTRINDQLGPCHRLVYPVRLPDFEMNQLRGEVDEMHDEEEESTSFFDYNNEAFYNSFRTLVGYPYPDETTTKTGKKKHVWPTFATKEQYENKPGAKLSASIEVVQALLSDDDIGPFTFDENDCPKFPPPKENAKQTRKVLIYHEYPMMVDTIISAFKVHGINVFAINGTQDTEERNEVVRKFVASTDPQWRVLLFSKVGACGLNLACANALLLYDVVWSDVEGIQIVGRIHRMGQTDPVHVFSMIAMGTTDVNMSYTAKFKDDMLKVLVTRVNAKKSDEERKKEEEMQNKMKNMLEGNVAKKGDDEDTSMELEEAPKKTRRGRKPAAESKNAEKSKKGKGKRGKAAVLAEKDDEDIDQEESAKQRGSKRKAEEVVDGREEQSKKLKEDGEEQTEANEDAKAADHLENSDGVEPETNAPKPAPIPAIGSTLTSELPKTSNDSSASVAKNADNTTTDEHMASPPPSRRSLEDQRMASPPPAETGSPPSRPAELSPHSLFSFSMPASSLPSIPFKPSSSRDRARSDAEMKDLSQKDANATPSVPPVDTRMSSPPPESPPGAVDQSITAAIESATDDLLNFDVGKDPQEERSPPRNPFKSTPRIRRTLQRDIAITPLSPSKTTETFGSPSISRTIKPSNPRPSRTKTAFESSSEDESQPKLPAIHVRRPVGIADSVASSRGSSVPGSRGGSPASSVGQEGGSKPPKPKLKTYGRRH